MWISVNSLGQERIHNEEPYYNRLHDKWQCINSIDAPNGTYSKFEEISYRPMAIFVDSIINNKAVITERVKIR